MTNYEGWTHDPSNDEPEITHTCGGYSFPQFCSFVDQEGNRHSISRIVAVALGLIGLKDSPDWRMNWDEYGELMENRRNQGK